MAQLDTHRERETYQNNSPSEGLPELNGTISGNGIRPWRENNKSPSAETSSQTPEDTAVEQPKNPLIGFFTSLREKVSSGFEAVKNFVSENANVLVDGLKTIISNQAILALNPAAFLLANGSDILKGIGKAWDAIKGVVTHPAFITAVSIALIVVGSVFPPAAIAGLALGTMYDFGAVLDAVISGDPTAIGIAVAGLALGLVGLRALGAGAKMLSLGAKEATELAAKNIGKEVVEKLALNPQAVQKLGSEIGTDAALGVKELIRKTPELAANPAQLEAVVKSSVSELTEKKVYAFLKEADTHKIVEQLTTEFLETFSRGGKKAIEKLMSFGMSKEAAEQATKELSKAIGRKGSKGAFDAELKDILEEHISKAIIEDLKKKGIKEAFEGSFSAQMQVVKKELAQEGIELSDDALKAIHKGAKEGFEEGLERGVRKIVREGIDEAFRKFRRARDLILSSQTEERKKKNIQSTENTKRESAYEKDFKKAVPETGLIHQANKFKRTDDLSSIIPPRKEPEDDLKGIKSFYVGETSFYGEDDFDYEGGLRGGELADALGIRRARNVDSSEIKITKEEEKV